MKLKITVDGKSYEVDIEVLEDDERAATPGYLPPHIGVPSTVQAMPAAASQAPSSVAEENVDESKVCRSPVAGVVVRIAVQPGQSVQAGDLIVVLEAMKMETNVTAPVAGKVKSIGVETGAGVKVNQILAAFE